MPPVATKQTTARTWKKRGRSYVRPLIEGDLVQLAWNQHRPVVMATFVRRTTGRKVEVRAIETGELVEVIDSRLTYFPLPDQIEAKTWEIHQSWYDEALREKLGLPKRVMSKHSGTD